MAFISGALYYLLSDNKAMEVVFPDAGIRKFAGGILERGKSLINPLIAPVIQKSENISNDFFSKTKNKVDETFNEVKSHAVEAVKKTINDKIDEVTGNTDLKPTQVASIGSISSGTKAPPQNDNFPLGFSVKKNQPAIFIIKNEGDGNMNFQIDWGDSKSDSGDLASVKSKTFFHIWDREGEYFIKILTTIGVDKKTYSSYILVYP